MTMVAVVVVTETSCVVAIIEVKTSLALLTNHRPVVRRKFLSDVAASALYIVIVHHEVAQLPLDSALHQSRAGTGLVALRNISSRQDLGSLASTTHNTSHW